MTQILYDELQDEDPINDYDEEEERTELIRRIYLAQCMTRFGGIDVRHNEYFTRHLRTTQFLKCIGEYLLNNGHAEKMVPSFVKTIKY